MTDSKIETTISSYFAATRAMDRKAWVAQFAEDGVSYDPVGAPPTSGREALGRFFDGIIAMFDQVGLTEDHVFVCGDQAAVKWTGRGKAKNGRDVRFEGIDVMEFDARGKIKTLNAFWDPAQLTAQVQ